MSTEHNAMLDAVATKHDPYKARLVTPQQEGAMDQIAADPFEDPISAVTVLSNTFHNQVVVYQTDGERERPTVIITQDGAAYRMAQ